MCVVSLFVSFPHILNYYIQITGEKKLQEVTNAGILSRTEGTESQNSRHTPRRSLTTDKRKPWRASDPVPKDIWRNNILENDDEYEKINRM